MFEVVDRLVAGVKKAREVAQKIHDAELQDAVADLTLDSAQLKMEMAELREENVRLKAELDAVRKLQDFRSRLEIRDGLYHAVEPIPGYGSGPFCPACLDAKEKLVTLFPVRRPDDTREVFRYDCRACKTPFTL